LRTSGNLPAYKLASNRTFLLLQNARLLRTVPNLRKKADVAKHPKVFDHVGLLVNEPPGTAGLLSI